MTSRKLEGVAQTLVAEGKGILAADETVPTLTKRFDALGIRSSRRGRVNRTDQKAGTLRMRETPNLWPRLDPVLQHFPKPLPGTRAV